MTAHDFVMSNMKKNESFGVEGYLLAKTMTNFDKALATKIHAGKKRTFVDDAVKSKKHVPDANYNVSIDWTKDKKANFNKDFRHTIPTDIERKAKKDTKPEPLTYKPEHRLVEPKIKGAFNLKGKRDDTSFLAEPMMKGHSSPKYHDKKHHLVEKRITA